MYTSKVTVYRSESFTVISHGNGAAYTVDDHVREASFFIQNEEGTQDVERMLDNTMSTDNTLAGFLSYFDPTDDEKSYYLQEYGEVLAE